MRIWGGSSNDNADPGVPEGGSVHEMLASASDAVGEVVAAAERAVARMRAHDADAADADTRITRERLVRELVGSVLDRTEALKAEAGELAEILDRAGARLEREDRPALTSPPAEAADRDEPAVDVAATPIPFSGRGEPSAGEPEAVPASGGPPAEGVRLLATQMAVAGSDRADVEARLARDFGVRDADRLLDELFSGERASGAG